MKHLQPPVKFTEHVVTTTKLIINRRRRPAGRKVVRLFITDADATDSSDDDGSASTGPFAVRVRRHVEEIQFEQEGHRKRVRRNSPRDYVTRRRNFRADPARRTRVWLGSYDSPEEAAIIRIRGPGAATNFSTAGAAAERDGGPPAAESPTSVLRSEEPVTFGWLGYGSAGDDEFGFVGVDWSLSWPQVGFSADQFGELEFDDIMGE